jgi:DNA recombination protein RmuC
MNPVSVLALLLLVAVAAPVLLALGRARLQGRLEQAQADAAAGQVELAQARERQRAAEGEAALVRAELERARRQGEAWRDELDASRDERARLAERASRVAPLEAELERTAAQLRDAIDEHGRRAASEAQKQQQAASLSARVAELDAELAAQRGAHEAAQARVVALTRELAELATGAEAERRHAAEKLRMLDEAKAALSDQFKSLANDILEEKAKRFAEQNQTSLGTLLDPLRAQLSEFKGKVEEVYVQEGKDRSALAEQVRHLMALNQTLSREASNLTQALKGSSKAQGNWGELILERVLEASGLQKGREYHVQDSRLSDDGRRLQPDVVLHLPEERRLVVDAKVSLVAYDRYTAAATDEERAAAARLHLESVRTHVKGLSLKRYQDLYGLKSLDMVVMFVPIEPAFMLAVTHDDALFMDAWQRNVLLVSPSTLLFVVRTIANLWRQEAQTRNAQEIARRGAELYDKLAAFVGDLHNVGAKLKLAQDAYQEAEKKLATGRGNVIRRAEELRKLGVKNAKALPATLVEAAAEDEALPALDAPAGPGEPLPGSAVTSTPAPSPAGPPSRSPLAAGRADEAIAPAANDAAPVARSLFDDPEDDAAQAS